MVFSNCDGIPGEEIWLNHLLSIHFIAIPPIAIFSPHSPRKEGGEVGIRSEY